MTAAMMTMVKFCMVKISFNALVGQSLPGLKSPNFLHAPELTKKQEPRHRIPAPHLLFCYGANT